MWDRCEKWRRRLSQQADGALPRRHWGGLQAHLARCPTCRRAQDADAILRDTLRLHTGMADRASRRAFNDRVVMTLRAEQAADTQVVRYDWPAPIRDAQARWSLLPFGFFRQIAGGALCAMGLTGLCLLSALHSPHTPTTDRAGTMERAARTAGRGAAPSVPLESLLESASPRAALLWTTPPGERNARGLTGEPSAAPRPARSVPSVPTDAANESKPLG